jgi:hypothetical protein
MNKENGIIISKVESVIAVLPFELKDFIEQLTDAIEAEAGPRYVILDDIPTMHIDDYGDSLKAHIDMDEILIDWKYLITEVVTSIIEANGVKEND